MFKLACFVLTKSDIFWITCSNQNDNIIKYFELCHGQTDTVRVEMFPINFDYRLPLDKWLYTVDMNIPHNLHLPDWYNAERGEKICREELAKWAEIHILRSGVHTGSGEVNRIVMGSAVLNVSNQCGGECWAIDGGTINSTKHIRGMCNAAYYGTVNSTDQRGGVCLAQYSGKVNSTNQRGGECISISGSIVNSTGQMDGLCWTRMAGAINSTSQIGGQCWAHNGGMINSTGQRGGRCWAIDGGTIYSANKHGGRCWAYDGGIKKEK